MFAYHDGPRLFTARNLLGHLYLVEWAAENELGDIWLLVPLSRARYQEIISAGIEFRDAYLKSETGFIYEAEISRVFPKVTVEHKPVEFVSATSLPAVGERVDDEEVEEIARARRLANSERHKTGYPSVDLRLTTNVSRGGMVEPGRLAAFLNIFQRFCNAVSAATDEATGKKHRRPRFGIAEVYSGSLGLVISPLPQHADVAETAVRTLSEVAYLVDNAIQRKSGVAVVRDAVFDQVVTYLKWFETAGVRASMTLISSEGVPMIETDISPFEIESVVDELRQKRRLGHGLVEAGLNNRSLSPPKRNDGMRLLPAATVPETELEEGTFFSLDTVRLTYGFRGGSGRIYTGSVRGEAVTGIQQVTFGRSYIVMLRLATSLGRGHDLVADLIEVAPFPRT